MNKLLKKASEVIETIEYINIASITSHGMPWNTPVYVAFDNGLNFYWLSWKKNVHSKNIRNNPNVFVTIYDSSCPAGTGFGAYMKGKAHEVTKPNEMVIGLKFLYGRQSRKAKAVVMFLKKFPRRLYKFTPEKIWVNGDGDVEGEFIDVRTELNLSKLKKLLD